MGVWNLYSMRNSCAGFERSAGDEARVGCRSPEGRALIALRDVLLRLGMPRKEIGASTLVAPLLARYGSRFLSPCLQFAPGALPPLKHVGRTHKALLVVMVALFLASLGLTLFKSPLGTWSLCLAFVTMLLPWIPHPLFRGSVVLPGITTLGGLARCLAKGRGGEHGAPPNGGPGEPLGNSGTSGGPPSVS